MVQICSKQNLSSKCNFGDTSDSLCVSMLNPDPNPQHSGGMVSTVTPQQEVYGLRFRLEALCVEFACSLCAYVGFFLPHSKTLI